MEEKRSHQNLPITGDDQRRSRDKPSHEREADILRAVLGGIEGLEEVIPIIVQRHEWFDGTGSLLGMRGEGILPEARVLAVADAFVDLATPKSHRAPITLNEVLKRLREGSGSQFDGRLVEALSSLILEEEERWGATARARRLEAARCRHWIGLGHFYRQSREPEWALRCYRAAERLAEAMSDFTLVLEAVSGQFMVFCDLGDADHAHQALSRIRGQAQDMSGPPRALYLLQWGILEFLRGNDENAEQIVSGVMEELKTSGDLPGLGAACAILSHMALVRRGVHDSGHLRWLGEFMQLLSRHDLFDVLVSYRPQTIPVLLSAMVHDLEASLARNLLTRLGEPCHDKLVRRLAAMPPSRWMDALRAEATPAAPDGAVPVLKRREADAAAPKADAPLRIRSLGTFRVETQGKTLSEDDWPTQKAMKIFAYLALRRGAGVPDQVLMDLFWPVADEERARNSLRNAVHQIRSLLKPLLDSASGVKTELVRSRRTGMLSLQTEAFLDVEAFEAAVPQATQMHAQARYAAAVTTLDEALALYRGDYLENVRDDWAQAPRTRLAEQHLRALDLLARCHLALGDAEAAEIAARKALGRDDLQEEAHVNLVESLAAQGRRTDALRQYQQAVVHFKREMGLDAPARLTQVYERMLR